MLKDLKLIPKILFDPVNFFSRLREQSIGKLYKFWVQLSFVNAAIGFVLSLFNISAWKKVVDLLTLSLGPSFPLVSLTGVFLLYIGLFVVMITIGFIIMMICSLIFHIFFYIFGGRGYRKTLTAFVIATTPTMILSSLPVVSMFASVYQLILGVVGLSKLHKFSIVKTILVFLIPMAIIGLIIGGLLFGAALLYLKGVNSITSSTSGVISLIDSSCTNNYIYLVISNDGTSDINAGVLESEIKVYVNNVEVEFPVFNPYIIKPGTTSSTGFDGNPGTNIVLVVSPSNTVRQTVYC